MKPLISVIVPIYNVAPYLRDCVNSLLNQNSDNYEIILVDDGSPDEAPAICDEYASKYSFIKVVHKQNGGLVSARKAGVLAATGEYIANVDGDDWVRDDFIQVIADIIKRHHPDVIHFDSVNVIGEGRTESHLQLSTGFYNLSEISEMIYPILIEDTKGHYFDTSVCDLVCGRDIYSTKQLEVDDSISVGEDASCSKPLLAEVSSLYITDKCLNFYRINQSSMTKGRKPFDLNYPMKVGKIFEASLARKNNFQSQIYRWVTHNLFTACASEFYSEDSYVAIRKRIKSALKNEFYQEAIKNCQYDNKYLKGNLARIALKYRLYPLMLLYCKSSLKEW